MRVALLGFGLIGGSVARALRAAPTDGEPGPAWSVAAWSPGGEGPAAAAADGVIDLAATTPEGAIEDADLVVLAGPVPVCLEQLDELAGPWRTALSPRAVITDVASTKGQLVLRATALGLRFVGGHPMAGREASGYPASSADLFVDRPWVVVPAADDATTERVEALARACRARPLRMAASVHDEAVAAISHLPLVVAAALVEAVATERSDWSAAVALAATGWRDTTRLARGDTTMGSGIGTTNGAGDRGSPSGPDRRPRGLAGRTRAAGRAGSGRRRRSIAGGARPARRDVRLTAERVLVVPRGLLPDRAAWHGLRSGGVGELLTIVAAQGRFEPRGRYGARPGLQADHSVPGAP